MYAAQTKRECDTMEETRITINIKPLLEKIFKENDKLLEELGK